MKKLVSLAVIVIMGFTLFGCGTVPDKNAGKQTPEQQTSEAGKNKPEDDSAEQKNTTVEKEKESKAAENEKEDTATENEKAQSEKALSKKIEVLVEGQKEMREATLAESKYLGYHIYVLDGFSLEAEEPGKDIIMSKFDGEFFARIEKLDGKVNLEEYKQSQKAGFAQIGKVTERDPESHFHEAFRDSKFWLLTEIGYEDNKSKKTSINYIIKEFNGQLFAVTFHMPLKEAAEGITPSLWAIVSTLEAQ